MVVAQAERLRRIGFQPGQSGNPAGRPAGARQKIAEGIVRDLADAWQRHGVATLNKLAKKDPATFARLAVGILPRDVLVSINDQRLPGGLEPDDWRLVLEVLQAVRETVPDVDQRTPGAVFGLVRDAMRAQAATVIDGGRQ